MRQRGLAARIFAPLAAFALVLSAAIPAVALNPVFGTIQVNGPVYVADEGDWDSVELTRPMVAGDRLKTGSEGYLLADLGSEGIVGMYSNTEISTDGTDEGPSIDVHAGKLAFHLAAFSGLKITAAGAEILPAKSANEQGADGYIEINEHGDAVVAVEEGELAVRIAGVDRTLQKGERLLLNQEALGGSFDENDRLAALDEGEQLAQLDGERSGESEASGMTEPADPYATDDAVAAPIVAGGGAGLRASLAQVPVEAAAGGAFALITAGVVIADDSSSSDTNGSPN